MYRDGATLLISDLLPTSGETAVIDSLRATRCNLLGPAVLSIAGATFDNCVFVTGTNRGSEGLLWKIDPDGQAPAGTIELRSCLFTECYFYDIGVALRPGAVRPFLENVQVE